MAIMVTWKQLKEAIERRGITDETMIHSLEFSAFFKDNMAESLIVEKDIDGSVDIWGWL